MNAIVPYLMVVTGWCFVLSMNIMLPFKQLKYSRIIFFTYLSYMKCFSFVVVCCCIGCVSWSWHDDEKQELECWQFLNTNIASTHHRNQNMEVINFFDWINSLLIATWLVAVCVNFSYENHGNRIIKIKTIITAYKKDYRDELSI